MLKAKGQGNQIVPILLGALLCGVFYFLPVPETLARCAAVATFLSNCATSVYFVFYLWRIRGRTVISLSPQHVTLEKSVSLGVLQIGLPSALQMLLSTASNMVLNHVIVGFDEAAMAGVGICKKGGGDPGLHIDGHSAGSGAIAGL